MNNDNEYTVTYAKYNRHTLPNDYHIGKQHIIWPDGEEGYYVKGFYHRITGPASTGRRGNRWFYEGHRCRSNSAFQQAANLSDEQMLELILKYGRIQ